MVRFEVDAVDIAARTIWAGAALALLSPIVLAVAPDLKAPLALAIAVLGLAGLALYLYYTIRGR